MASTHFLGGDGPFKTPCRVAVVEPPAVLFRAHAPRPGMYQGLRRPIYTVRSMWYLDMTANPRSERLSTAHPGDAARLPAGPPKNTSRFMDTAELLGIEHLQLNER